MRRWILLLVMLTCGVAMMMGQEGLNVAPCFSPSYASNGKVTMVTMTGEQLKWAGQAGLKSYRSVSVSGDDELSVQIERAVRKDGAKADYKETSYKDGKLHFGFYSLGGRGSGRRYLLYLNRPADGESKTTLIYIQGDMTPAEVKKLMNREKK